MGVAGVGLFDNDDAMDVVEEWDRLIGRGWDGKRIVSTLLDEWGDSVSSGSLDVNRHVLALVGLSLKHGLAVSTRLKDIAEKVISWELEESSLSDWEDPRARRDVLVELLEKIGGRLRVARKRVKDALLSFSSRSEMLNRLKEIHRVCWEKEPWPLVVSMLLGGDLAEGLSASEPEREERKKVQAWVRKNVPTFMLDLFLLLEQGIEEKPAKIHDAVFEERRAMLACVVGIIAGFDGPELEELLKRLP